MSLSPLAKLTKVEQEIIANLQVACKDLHILNSTNVLPPTSKIRDWMIDCEFAGSSALSLVLTIIKDTAAKRVAEAVTIDTLANEMADTFLKDMGSSSIADRYQEAYEELKEYRADMVSTFTNVMNRYRV